MLKICLVFWESEPQYAYKCYAYKKKHVPNDFIVNMYCQMIQISALIVQSRNVGSST